MKMPNWFSRKKKLLVTARRATASGADFDDLSEPNMKLSRALLIVLLLHVVAVAGIIAFNVIKSRQGGLPIATNATAALRNHEQAKATPAAPPKTVKKAKAAESIPDG